VVESPLLGPAGNKEFLVLIEKNKLTKSNASASSAIWKRPVAPKSSARPRASSSAPGARRLRGTNRPAPMKAVTADAARSREVDLLLVFGGDGTMLHVAREIAGSPRPCSASTSAGLAFSPPCPSMNCRAR
jgi:NAD kinase